MKMEATVLVIDTPQSWLRTTANYGDNTPIVGLFLFVNSATWRIQKHQKPATELLEEN